VRQKKTQGSEVQTVKPREMYALRSAQKLFTWIMSNYLDDVELPGQCQTTRTKLSSLDNAELPIQW
jgi:hypothetical protein